MQLLFGAWFAAVVLLLQQYAATVAAADPVPRFPLQIIANIKITAHQVPEDSVFPPRTRRMRIHYDYLFKRGRIDIEEGYEAAKTYVRRYDLKQEYMIRDPPISDCKRSYLGETMPFPEIPVETRFIGEESLKVEGGDTVRVNHFLFEDPDVRVHMYLTADGDAAPVRLVEEALEFETDSTADLRPVAVPMLTYDYNNVVLNADPEDTAELYEVPEPYTHGTCDRHVGGFPYVHVFHYFARF